MKNEKIRVNSNFKKNALGSNQKKAKHMESNNNHYIKMFECNYKTVKKIANALNNSIVSAIVPSYKERYGVGWQIKLGGDVLACAVDWCYRDYTNIYGKPTDMDDFLAKFDEYEYLDLYANMGLTCVRLPPKTERALTVTYALAMIEG